MRTDVSALKSLSISSVESFTPLSRTVWHDTGIPFSTSFFAAADASGVTSSAQLNCVLSQTFPLAPSLFASASVTRPGLVHGARVHTRTMSICLSCANASTKRMTSSSVSVRGSTPESSTSRMPGLSATYCTHAASCSSVRTTCAFPRSPRLVQCLQFMKHLSDVIMRTLSGKRCFRPWHFDA